MKIKTNENQQLLLDLFRAYFDTRKNKRRTANALAFEADYENKLFVLYEEIINRRYTIGQSICFMVDKPIKREIFAADFRDRIVHHLIFNYINPIFEHHFIKDSYSCRIGKGTSDGVRRVSHFIRSCSENYTKDCWILKLDIQGYFMAMDRNILYKKIESKLRTVRNPEFDVDLILYLIYEVIHNDPTRNCHVKGSKMDWKGLPKSKSLFFSPNGKGFPIGNLTSQLFGNIYLDELDHFVHENIKVKYYGRYVDDMVFVHVDKEFLQFVILEIKDYLKTELGLTLHPKKIYLQNFRKGVYFLGVFVKPYRIYIGKKTKHNFYEKLRLWNNLILEKKEKIEKENIEKFIACVNSYLGIMKHHKTYSLRKKMVIKNIIKEWWSYVFLDVSFNKIELIKNKNIWNLPHTGHVGNVGKIGVGLVDVAEQSRAEQSRAEQFIVSLYYTIFYAKLQVKSPYKISFI